MDPNVERGNLSQIIYGLIFAPDLTDPRVAERLADAIAGGRATASPPADLVAAIDSALANGRIDPQAVGIASHSEADLLAFLTRLRALLRERGCG